MKKFIGLIGLLSLVLLISCSNGASDSDESLDSGAEAVQGVTELSGSNRADSGTETLQQAAEEKTEEQLREEKVDADFRKLQAKTAEFNAILSNLYNYVQAIRDTNYYVRCAAEQTNIVSVGFGIEAAHDPDPHAKELSTLAVGIMEYSDSSSLLAKEIDNLNKELESELEVISNKIFHLERVDKSNIQKGEEYITEMQKLFSGIMPLVKDMVDTNQKILIIANKINLLVIDVEEATLRISVEAYDHYKTYFISKIKESQEVSVNKSNEISNQLSAMNDELAKVDLTDSQKK